MSAKNIFRQVEDAVKDVRKAKKTVDQRDGEQLVLIQNKEALLDEIVAYINSYNWVSHKRLKERMTIYLKGKCNLQLLADTCNLSYGAAQQSVTYATKILCERLGKSTIKLILADKLDEARAQFYCNSGKSELQDFILAPALDVMPTSKYMTVSLSNCETELKFLQQNAKEMLKRRIEAVDKDKLAYLTYILEKDNPKYTKERLLLLKLLKVDISVNQLLKEVEKIEKVY